MGEKQIRQTSKMLGVLVEHLMFFNSMSSADKQWVIRNPKKAIQFFKDYISNNKGKDLRIFDSVYSVDIRGADIIRALEHKCKLVDTLARNIIHSAAFLKSLHCHSWARKNICLMSAEEIAGKPHPSNSEVWQGILALGGEFCPMELGPLFMMQVDCPQVDYLLDRRLKVAMNPLDKNSCTFIIDEVSSEQKPTFSVERSNPNALNSPLDNWIFVVLGHA